MFSATKFLMVLALSSLVGSATFAAQETWPEGTQFVVRMQKGTSETRYQVFFKEPAMADFEAMTAEELKTFPALLAYTPQQFLRLNADSATDALANRELSPENLKEFWALLKGNSTTYMKASATGAQLPMVKGVPASLTAGQVWFDSESKAIRFYNGSSVHDLGLPPGTGVRSVTAGAGLTGGTITTVGTIALENFGTPGTYYKVTTDIKGRVKTGATSLVEADIPNLVTAGKVSGSAIVAGEIGGNTSINTTGNLKTMGAISGAAVSATNVSTSNLRIFDSSNSHQVGLNVAASTADYQLTFPVALPSENGQVLGANKDGQLAWVSMAVPGPVTLGLMDLRSKAGLTQVPTNCTAAQTMQYSSVVDQLLCTPIAITHAAVSGLGEAALKNVGTAAGTVAAGDDVRFGNALKLQGRQVANAAPSNAQVLTWNDGAQVWQPQTLPQGPQGTLTSLTAGHGLTGGTITTSGTIAVNAGTGAGQILEMDSSARLPAVDGSQLANVNAVKLQGQDVAGQAPVAGQFLKFDGAQWVPAKIESQDLPPQPPPVTIAPAAYAYQVNTANTVFSGTIPWNDSVPNNSQGSEVFATTITPSSANSLIEVNALIHFSQPFNKSRFFTVAAFQDAATSAFATSATSMTGVSCSGGSDVPYLCQATLTSVFVAGRTSPITIRIRAGGDVGTWEINGSTGRKLGGSLQSTLILREVKR